MILVDTSVMVAWLDTGHPDHKVCSSALEQLGGVDELAISSMTFAELAAGGRNREALDEDLQGFIKLDFTFDAAFRAGQAFGQCRPKKGEPKPVLPDFLIRGHAAVLGVQHLTNDRRGVSSFPEVDFLFPSNSH